MFCFKVTNLKFDKFGLKHYLNFLQYLALIELSLARSPKNAKIYENNLIFNEPLQIKNKIKHMPNSSAPTCLIRKRLVKTLFSYTITRMFFFLSTKSFKRFVFFSSEFIRLQQTTNVGTV